MKKTAPKFLAIRIAIITGIFTVSILALIYTLTGFYLKTWEFFFIGVLVGLFTYIGIQLSIGRYLKKQMRKVFQTLNQARDEKLNTEINLDEDNFYHLNQKLMNWAEHTENQIKELQKAENYRREFVGNVSHELKTPIFNIQGYVHTLLDGGLEDPGINKKYLEKASRNIERLSAIVEDLEAISQLESGELKLTFERFDLSRLIQDVIEAMEIRARERNITLKSEQPGEQSFMAKGDIGRIRQVLTNLVSNSIKYGKDNGTTIIRIIDKEDFALIEVEDDGIGVAKENLPRLFERFYRVDKSRSREQGGTGLGLSIVKHILEAHGQQIDVDSEPGKGTTFRFTLKKP